MTHTSGMRPGISWNAREPWSGYEEGIARACREPLAYAPGTDFVYSDINFILLGEIVHRVSGVGLDAFAARPKPVVGFSDITALLLALYHRTGAVTFHGPVAR